jgi:serine/threonine protein kinase
LQVELKEVQKSLCMSWPSPQDYNEALQNPAYSFADPVLAGGQPELNKLGLPRPRSGMFACVYKVHSGNCDWAVRCFLQSRPEQWSRYARVREALAAAALPCTVAFDLQERGICVAGHHFPMLKMEWCEGATLNHWLARNLRNKAALEDFLENWRSTLKMLSDAGIAHGDLQHGNILIQDGHIRLVDYDGIYVPTLKGLPPTELGHRSYQHPERNDSHFGPYLDNFSAWLIYVSVLISGCDPNVWQDFEGGDECLLFRKQDLDNPQESELFHVLEHHRNPQIRECSRTLRYLLTLNPEDVPGLEAPVEVPESLPELDSILSDLPDLPEWIATSDGSGGPMPVIARNSPPDTGSETAAESQPPVLPEGKRLLKRRRRKGAPLYTSGEQTPSGRWIYREDGLSFKPDPGQLAALTTSESASGSAAGSAGQAGAVVPVLHSPLLETFTCPAPYRNINGKLHSPLLEDDSLTNDFSGSSSVMQQLLNLTPDGWRKVASIALGVVVLTAVVGLCFPQKAPVREPVASENTVQESVRDNKPADPLWPDGQYCKLLEGRVAMEEGNIDTAEALFSQGIADLQKINDDRVPKNLAYLYDNLGKIHSYRRQFQVAERDFKQSLQQWQRFYGNKSTEYATVLLESAETATALGHLAVSEKDYEQALTTLENNGFTTEPFVKSARQEYVSVLMRLHKQAKAGRVATRFPEEPQASSEESQPASE